MLTTKILAAGIKIAPRSLKEELKRYIDNAVGNRLAAQSAQVNEAQTNEAQASSCTVHQAQINEVSAQVNDAQVLLQQVLSIFRWELNAPPPPKHLQVRVVGGYSPSFIESGFNSVYPDLNQALKPAGKELKDFRMILDFGCGCGRATRALATLLPESKLYATDIDGEAIKWLQDNYSKYAEFFVAPHLPPTVFEERTFDLVFGISVFTHLPEDMQYLWLKELKRIIKPQGYLLLTTHGEKHFKGLPVEAQDILGQKGFYYGDFGFNYGKSISLPDFYQNTYHSHSYIKKEWGQFFDVIHIETLGLQDHQDIVLLQNRS